MNENFDPEGKHLPIKLDSTTNGEFAPILLSPAPVAANQLVLMALILPPRIRAEYEAYCARTSRLLPGAY